MLITIENFGAIKYFQFDTEKDLYLIFGKNSVGKSYAISLVYLIIKKIIEYSEGGNKYIDDIQFAMAKVEPDIKILTQKVEEGSDAETDISNHIEKILISYLNGFIKELNNSLINTFNDISNLQNKFTKNKLQIRIDFFDSNIGVDFHVILKLRKNTSKNTELKVTKCGFSKPFIVEKIKTFSNLENIAIAENKIVIFFQKEDDNFKQIYLGIIGSFLRFFNELQKVSNVYYLPASRSGLYQALSAFGQIVAELAKNRSLISRQIELPAISEPVADYFLHLSNINTSRKPHNDFVTYVNEIEKEILKGIVEFDSKSKKLFFTPNETSLKLDLSTTSSMVSEISPIVSYIKYIFPFQRSSKKEQKPLVFIEEPEAHLHPETQVKLMAVFARLVKDNKIKLVMTSHSNYIFNKASNLVIDNKIDREKFEAILFENTQEGSVARNLDTDEYGIEDDNFIDTAESIYEEKLELINKLNS